MKQLILGQIILSFLLTSCSVQRDAFAPAQAMSNLATPGVATGECSLEKEVTPGQNRPFVANLNTLGIDLYHILTQEDQTGNLIFSPLGIVSAFSVAYAGARQGTAADMAQFLHFLPQADQHPQFRSVHCYLNSLANKRDVTNQQNGEKNIPFQLELANALWSQEKFPFSQKYFATVSDNYKADLQVVDFILNPAQAIQQINQWVQQKSAGRIQELVTKDEITTNTRLVIANSVYFKASWLHPFLPAQTEPQPFTLLTGDTIVVPLMHNLIRSPYLKASGYQAALLPYTGEAVELLILLPDPERFSEIEQNFNLETVGEIVANAKLHDISLTMPSFELKNRVDLIKTLRAAGLHSPFDPTQANFDGMTDSRNGLYISAALQEATITVDEKGTEAAAATGVVMAVSGIEKAELIVNRPFIYALRERESNAILFMGRVMNPADSLQ